MIHFAEAENHFNSAVIFYQHESITPQIYNLIFKIYFLILKYMRNEVFFDLSTLQIYPYQRDENIKSNLRCSTVSPSVFLFFWILQVLLVI